MKSYILFGIAACFYILPLLVTSSPEDPPLKSLLTENVYLHFNCSFCEIGITAFKTLIKLHASNAFIAKTALEICEKFHIEDTSVCKGAINTFKDELITVIRHTDLSASDTCVMMFGSICSKLAYDPEINWKVKLPKSPLPPAHNWPQPAPNAPKIRILHLTDIHVDLLYKPGSNANCGEPLCCRDTSQPVKKEDRAGYWGDYRYCDIPEWTLDNMLQHIIKNEKFDIVYWTGDLPPHDVWKQTRGQQLSLLQTLADKLVKYFPHSPIYSAVGNHESTPVDSFPPPFITGNRSESWLYKVLDKTWTHWLPKSTSPTIKYGAFYTALVKPGYRVVSLNTNYCDHRNWWLIMNVTDPAQELQWLVDTLQSAEVNNEKVHILGHIPPGDSDCYRVWSRNFHDIVVRYSNTIAGQFFGHTHQDQFELFYDSKSSIPVSVGYVAPSVTTYRMMNPGYRVYTVDGFYKNSSWAVLDHETTIMNITAANLYNDTTWFKEYSAKSAYHMSDLSPPSWNNLAHQMHVNNTLFTQFYRHYFKLNPPPGVCDATCKDAMLCDLHMSTFGDRTYCDSKMTTPTSELLEQLMRNKLC